MTADEATIAPALAEVVAAHDGIKLGSYPRFDEQDFRVMLTLEGRDAARVAAAAEALVATLGDAVVRRDG